MKKTISLIAGALLLATGAKAQVPQVLGIWRTRRTARPPGRPFIVRTEEPTASTTPMNSWPIRFPVSLGVIES